MLIQTLAAAATSAAPQNKFGILEALFPGGKPNWIPLATFSILALMSFGSFFILFTKYYEQSKVNAQYKAIAAFWRAPTLREGATKLEKNSAWRQIVDDGLLAEDQTTKLVDQT